MSNIWYESQSCHLAHWLKHIVYKMWFMREKSNHNLTISSTIHQVVEWWCREDDATTWPIKHSFVNGSRSSRYLIDPNVNVGDRDSGRALNETGQGQDRMQDIVVVTKVVWQCGSLGHCIWSLFCHSVQTGMRCNLWYWYLYHYLIGQLGQLRHRWLI